MFYVRKRMERDGIVVSLFYNTQVLGTVSAYLDPNDSASVDIEVVDGMSMPAAEWSDLLEDKINAAE